MISAIVGIFIGGVLGCVVWMGIMIAYERYKMRKFNKWVANYKPTLIECKSISTSDRCN